MTLQNFYLIKRVAGPVQTLIGLKARFGNIEKPNLRGENGWEVKRGSTEMNILIL